MNTKSLKVLSLFLLLNGLALPATANTLSTANLPDEQQPVHISADSLDIQDKTGTSLYQGNVEINQGSLTLNGDRITIKHPDRAIQSIKVAGQQARFKRFDQENKSWVKGQADTIFYNAQSKTILLVGNAKVEQAGKHLITGPKLNYDMVNKTLKAQSTPEEQKQISVTLMPAAKVEPNTTDSAE